MRGDSVIYGADPGDVRLRHNWTPRYGELATEAIKTTALKWRNTTYPSVIALKECRHRRGQKLDRWCHVTALIMSQIVISISETATFGRKETSNVR